MQQRIATAARVLLVAALFTLAGCTQYSPWRDARTFDSGTVDTRDDLSVGSDRGYISPASDRPTSYEIVRDWEYQEPPTVPDGSQPVRRLQRFSFAPGSTSLNREAQGALREIVDDLRSNTRWNVLLVGFTDASESSAYDPFELSTDRTQAAERFLLSNGIDRSRISRMALGSRYAEGDRFEPAAMASDRRVEVWAFMK
jgi:outer membrane protein OmpA-like peptidoglycan-associated protein